MMLNSSSLLSFFVSCCQAQERESNIKFFVHHFSASAPLQGTWSLWSPWSSCNQDCLQHRRRACNNRQTLVSNSVTKVLCRGDERESSNCHGDLCNEGTYAHIVWKFLKMSHLNFSTFLVRLFDCKLQAFKTCKIDLFGIFTELFARNGEWDFFCDFQTP